MWHYFWRRSKVKPDMEELCVVNVYNNYIAVFQVATNLFLTLVKSEVRLPSISSLKSRWDKWITNNWTRLGKISLYLLVARRSTVCQSWKWEYILVDLRNAKNRRYCIIAENNWQKKGSMENSLSMMMNWWWRNICRSPIYTPANSYESKSHHNPSRFNLVHQ